MPSRMLPGQCHAPCGPSPMHQHQLQQHRDILAIEFHASEAVLPTPAPHHLPHPPPCFKPHPCIAGHCCFIYCPGAATLPDRTVLPSAPKSAGVAWMGPRSLDCYRRHVSCSGSPTGTLRPVSFTTPAAASYPDCKAWPLICTCGKRAASSTVPGALVGTPRMWTASMNSLPFAAPVSDRTAFVMTPESPVTEATEVYQICDSRSRISRHSQGEPDALSQA